MSKITIELVGAEDLAKILALAGAKAVPALKQALTEEAQIVFRDSQRLVPVDTGTLRRSGIIIPVRERGSLIEVAMGYGGAASSYALRQHENLQYRHKKGQQAKYLETPLFSRANKLFMEHQKIM